MLCFDIFGNFSRTLLTLIAFGCLIWSLAGLRHLKTASAMYSFTAALACIFATSVLQNFFEIFDAGNVSVKILLITEMLFVLGGVIFLFNAASMLVFHTSLNSYLIFLIVTIGLIVSVYSIFISGDANLLINFRQLLPIVGMICVMLGFVSYGHFYRYLSRVTAALTCAAFATLMSWSMYFETACAWYVPAFLLLLLAFSCYSMVAEDTKKRLDFALEQQERTNGNIESIVKSSPFPIIISKLKDDTLILANRNAIKMFGINENELERYHLKDFFVDMDNRKLLLERLERNQEVQDFEILVKSAAGQTPFWLLMSANAVDYNDGVVLYSAFQNITDRKRREDILQTQADRDPLTSIFNRRYFEDHAAQKIKQSRYNKQPFAVLMFDADHFKRVNDTYGHKIGDKVLIELASVCERTLRPEDLVARYGGEEFVVFLNNVTSDIALLVANRLREAINASVVYTENNEPVRFTVSIGVAPSGISENVSRMIKMADDAMYLAKQKGRDRIELYTELTLKQLEQAQKHKYKETENQIHPAFLSEEDHEISLLDGIESHHIIEE